MQASAAARRSSERRLAARLRGGGAAFRAARARLAEAADAGGRDDHVVVLDSALRGPGDVVLRPERVELQRARAAVLEIERDDRGVRAGRVVRALLAVGPVWAELVLDPVTLDAVLIKVLEERVVLPHL